MKTCQVCHKLYNELNNSEIDQQYTDVCPSCNKAFGNPSQVSSSQEQDEDLNSVSSRKNEENQISPIPLDILSLLIFLISPFIGGAIVNIYSPQNGSWGCPGLLHGFIFWGISGFFGTVLGILSLKENGSPLAFFATIMNSGVAIFVLYVFVRASNFF